eukprot:gene19713-26404_t
MWPILQNHIPEAVEGYFEPFLGGGSILLNVLKLANAGSLNLSGPVVVNDSNTALINAFRTIKNNVEELVPYLAELFSNCTEEAFYQARTLFNLCKDSNTIQSAGLFVYLNRTCFRGLYRESMSGAYNVPYGNYKNPSFDARLLRELSVTFHTWDVLFENMDFKDFLSNGEGASSRIRLCTSTRLTTP